jgi:hypothetical protein
LYFLPSLVIPNGKKSRKNNIKHVWMHIWMDVGMHVWMRVCTVNTRISARLE